jgi:voltage-gated potassium channel Kch
VTGERTIRAKLSRRLRDLLSRYWSADEGLTLFFLMLCLLLFVVYPLVEISTGIRYAGDIFFSLLLISGALTIRKSATMKGLVLGAAVLAIVAHWMRRVGPGWPLYTWEAALAMLCIVLFIVVIMRHVFQPGPMTLHRVLGAVSVYMLLGLLWAFAYRIVARHFPGAIHFDFQATDQTLMSRLVYFSFSTLTTVGYGDITALHPLARALVVSEALVGQLFPVMMIGGLLSMALQSRHKS